MEKYKSNFIIFTVIKNEFKKEVNENEFTSTRKNM